MTGKTVGYIRVSTADQNTERQLDGVALDKVFTDKASGKDANRPQLQRCLEFLREGDTLVVHSMDRLARNVDDMRRIVTELTGEGITIRFVKENLTFTGDTSPMQRLMLTLMAAFAEFERSIIRERQREGIALAKAKGVYKGRKPSLSPEQVAELQRRAKLGDISKAQLARDYNISRETLYQYLRGT